MNLLFLSLLYHPLAAQETACLSRDGLQNQINNYQWAFVGGLRENLKVGESLTILNALPVGIFPFHYRKLFLKTRRFGADFQELGSLNLPWFKQRARQRKATEAIKAWAQKSPENRHILLYTLYLPYMEAILEAKREYPDLKATVIVTDLPNELGIASGRRGLLKRAEYAMGDHRVSLCRGMDGFVLLTKSMAEALPIDGKPQLVMEGLILPEVGEAAVNAQPSADEEKPAVLYTGTLNKEFGIGDLLSAFAQLRDECQLWLCGKGDLEGDVRKAADTYSNIRYFGFVSQQEALDLQEKAAVLINPRSPQGVYTRYSFPSKTLEYMRSGKPVLCYHLDGIPAEYDDFLVYIAEDGAEGIEKAVRSLFARPEAERAMLGSRAKAFVLSQKSAGWQCAKLLSFLRRV